jgi:uncharacterized oligopeptide transporter (OPT) family protein
MTGPAAPSLDAPRELTARALAVGLLVGLLLATANLYMGLKVGMWDSGNVTASILSFSLAAAIWRRGPRLGPLETNVAQSAAASTGAGPAVAGLLGAVPALTLLGREPPGWAVASLGLALGVLGTLVALGLRRRLLEDEGLAFPTGMATGAVIRGLDEGTGSKATRALGLAGVASAALAAARDLLGWMPQMTPLPLRVGAHPAATFQLGIGWSPMFLGVGLLVGLRTGLSVLLGGAIAWGLVAPRLVGTEVAGPDYAGLAAWLAWPGVALLLGSSLVSLAGQARRLPAALRDLRSLGGGDRRAADLRTAGAIAAVAAAGAVALASAAFDLAPVRAAGALALAVLLAGVCARAAGQTDYNPVGEMGQLGQLALGGGAGGAGSVAAGQLIAGPSAQVGVALWSLRAGQELGARPALQARALLAGSLLGAAIGVPLYWVLARAHRIGSEALPAPAARTWVVVADLMARGSEAIPAGALAASALALAAGAALEALGRRYPAVPSPSAVGMGFIVPAFYGAAICAGALLGWVWRRAARASAEDLAPSVGAGAVAGESLAGALIAVLVASGIVRPP